MHERDLQHVVAIVLIRFFFPYRHAPETDVCTAVSTHAGKGGRIPEACWPRHSKPSPTKSDVETIPKYR